MSPFHANEHGQGLRFPENVENSANVLRIVNGLLILFPSAMHCF